jgi:hypothetical protein
MNAKTPGEERQENTDYRCFHLFFPILAAVASWRSSNFVRNWAIRCSDCNSPVHEFQEREKHHGDLNPICQSCGASFIESDESTSQPDPEPRGTDQLEEQCKSL